MGGPVMITHEGKTMNLGQWSEEIGVSVKTISKRTKAGDTIADIIAEPNRSLKPITHGGKTRGMRQWAQHIGISFTHLRYRLNKGESLAQIIDQPSGTSKGNPIHGWVGTETYRSWAKAKQRCKSKRPAVYERYAGRGITMCERWIIPKVGFLNFLEDMGERLPGTSLDRRDNDRGYYKENCRWATPKQQANNRRPAKNALWISDGKVIERPQYWAKKLGRRASNISRDVKAQKLPGFYICDEQGKPKTSLERP